MRDSNLDINSALNTIRFLSVQQPITAETLELVPIGVKNTTLTPFDVYRTLFTPTTSINEAIEVMEIFGSPNLISFGVLENIDKSENIYTSPEGMCSLLDGLCFTDITNGDLSYIGMAGVPFQCNIGNTGLRRLSFPSKSFACEAQIKRNSEYIKNYKDLNRIILSPPQHVISQLSSKIGKPLLDKIVRYHREMGITYKKNSSGVIVMDPPLDGILFINSSIPDNLKRFRELIMHELEKSEDSSIVSKRIENVLESRKEKQKKEKKNFWGQVVEDEEIHKTQILPDINYRYHEGLTHAVRRAIVINKFIM